MSDITDWAAGKPCERHDLAFCTDCRDLAGMRRDADGNVSYDNDCAVRTFAEITGVGYEDAVELLRETGGYRHGRGMYREDLVRAFREAGFTVTPVTRVMSLDRALEASRGGRRFYVSGHKGRKGHAWSLVDGKANRPYQPPFKYFLFEVADQPR